MATLGEMAEICRSKNAGPFLLTVDFLFRDKAKYEAVKNSNTLQAEEIAALYHVKPEQVGIHYFDAVKAPKVTMPRIHSWAALSRLQFLLVTSIPNSSAACAAVHRRRRNHIGCRRSGYVAS